MLTLFTCSYSNKAKGLLGCKGEKLKNKRTNSFVKY